MSDEIYANVRTWAAEKRKYDAELATLRTQVADLRAAAEEGRLLLWRAAEACPRCKGTGDIWYQRGPDDADRDPCEDCLDYRMASARLREAATQPQEVQS